MLRRIILVIGLLAVSVGLTSLVLFDHFTGRFPWSREPGDGSVVLGVHSIVLNEDRDIRVWLPRNYDTTRTYPVIYALDGGSHAQNLAHISDILSAGDLSPTAIVVGIPNLSDQSRQRDLTPPTLRQDAENVTSPMGEGDRFLQFMETELIPFVEKRFPASGHRLLSGNSRGGLLVLYSLSTRPELFEARFCFSTPFWRQEGLIIDELAKFLATRDTLNTLLYVSAGGSETENIRKGANDIADLLGKNFPVALSWQVEYTPGADHHDNAERSIPRALAAWARFPRGQAQQ